jgi:hypothetical protein
MTEEAGQWVAINGHPGFEIHNQFPYQIRKVGTERLIAITLHKATGYNQVRLNGRTHKHHRIIAQQFLPNPDELPEVDHKKRIKTDNHIENLRWVSSSENNKNRTSNNSVIYELVDELPGDCFIVPNYGNHEFNDLHYSPITAKFYKHTGVEYRVLPILEKSNRHRYFFVCGVDTNNRQVLIFINKFRRLYNIL